MQYVITSDYLNFLNNLLQYRKKTTTCGLWNAVLYNLYRYQENEVREHFKYLHA